MHGLLVIPYNNITGIYDQNFVASNQKERADNVMEFNDNDGSTSLKRLQINQIKDDLRNFKMQNDLDKVICLWTANTERCIRHFLIFFDIKKTFLIFFAHKICIFFFFYQSIYVIISI